MSGQGRGRGRGQGRGRGRGGGGRGSGRGSGGSRPNSSSRPGGVGAGRGPPSRQNSSASAGGGGGGASRSGLVNGQKGADVHTVSESDRIRFTQILIDFREDHSRESLTMPPDLTNTERKFLHSLAGQLGLKSKSSGKGENRCITVSRLSNLKKVAGASGRGGGNSRDDGGGDGEDDSGLPVLRVGRQGLEALRSYRRRHPPSAVEEAESRMTGSSLLKSVLGIGGAGTSSSIGNKNIDHQDDDDDDAGDDVVMSTSAATADMGTADANATQGTAEEQVSILQALDELHISATSQGPVRQAPRKHVDIARRMALHRSAQMAKARNKLWKQMQEGRKKLPAYSYRKEVCDIVYGNRVTILAGDTGWYVTYDDDACLLDVEFARLYNHFANNPIFVVLGISSHDRNSH